MLKKREDRGQKNRVEGVYVWLREVEKEESVESVIWLLRNSTGDSCCYTWSDSLPLQLCEPHAQYDFTTSSLPLEIPFFHAAPSPCSLLSVCCGGALTEKQVHDLVSPLFPKRVWASPRLSSARRAWPKSPVRVMCFLDSRLHSAAVAGGAAVVIPSPFIVSSQREAKQALTLQWLSVSAESLLLFFALKWAFASFFPVELFPGIDPVHVQLWPRGGITPRMTFAFVYVCIYWGCASSNSCLLTPTPWPTPVLWERHSQHSDCLPQIQKVNPLSHWEAAMMPIIQVTGLFRLY